MNRLILVRVGVMVAGLLVWGYGASSDDAQLRMIGIGLLAASLVLRFFKPRRGPEGGER